MVPAPTDRSIEPPSLSLVYQPTYQQRHTAFLTCPACSNSHKHIGLCQSKGGRVIRREFSAQQLPTVSLRHAAAARWNAT